MIRTSLLRTALPIHAIALVLMAGPGCSRIPGCSSQKATVKRVSEKMSVPCETRRGRRPRDGCVTRQIRCGDRIKGNTAGGKAHFDGDFYRSKFCVPFDGDYSGPERVYLLEVPENTTAHVWMDSDCADLDLFALRWNYDGKCPTTRHNISQCEGDDSKSGESHVALVSTNRAGQYLVVVDGKDAATGAFGLTVDCQ